MQLLIATTNPGKIREIRQVLEGVDAHLVTLSDLPPIVEPDETGRTFAENAAIKARAYARASGLPTVAEDSGLVIDALGGRPGIHSARYPGATYDEKFRNLYSELSPHPRPWTARFTCALAFIDLSAAGRANEKEVPPTFTAVGHVEGEIAPVPSGTEGFGYDPIFFYPPYGCTLGEVSGARKLAVAHRGQAFRMFRAWLESEPRDP
jgi:XTP/dITP diphosphohydrolase